MKLSMVVLVVIFSLSAFIMSGNKKFQFKKLYKLEGVWKMNTKRGVIVEEWKKANKHYLQSKGYMIKGNDTIVSERVALTQNKEGIFYTSTVEDQNNKQPVAFKMTKAENNLIVFENPKHDFPKRIVYNFITTDSLHAFVDDGNNESKKRQNFYYKRQ